MDTYYHLHFVDEETKAQRSVNLPLSDRDRNWTQALWLRGKTSAIRNTPNQFQCSNTSFWNIKKYIYTHTRRWHNFPLQWVYKIGISIFILNLSRWQFEKIQLNYINSLFTLINLWADNLYGCYSIYDMWGNHKAGVINRINISIIAMTNFLMVLMNPIIFYNLKTILYCFSLF